MTNLDVPERGRNVTPCDMADPVRRAGADLTNPPCPSKVLLFRRQEFRLVRRVRQIYPGHGCHDQTWQPFNQEQDPPVREHRIPGRDPVRQCACKTCRERRRDEEVADSEADLVAEVEE